MEEIEDVLGIRSYPMNWPIGTDGHYKGIYHRETEKVELFSEDTSHGQEERESVIFDLKDPKAKEIIGD